MEVHPFLDVVTHAQEIIKKGGEVFQQFNCANCGTKQTMSTRNIFYQEGKCEECGHITDIVKDGCNFLVVWTRGPR